MCILYYEEWGCGRKKHLPKLDKSCDLYHGGNRTFLGPAPNCIGTTPRTPPTKDHSEPCKEWHPGNPGMECPGIGKASEGGRRQDGVPKPFPAKSEDGSKNDTQKHSRIKHEDSGEEERRKPSRLDTDELGTETNFSLNTSGIDIGQTLQQIRASGQKRSQTSLPDDVMLLEHQSSRKKRKRNDGWAASSDSCTEVDTRGSSYQGETASKSVHELPQTVKRPNMKRTHATLEQHKHGEQLQLWTPYKTVQIHSQQQAFNGQQRYGYSQQGPGQEYTQQQQNPWTFQAQQPAYNGHPSYGHHQRAYSEGYPQQSFGAYPLQSHGAYPPQSYGAYPPRTSIYADYPSQGGRGYSLPQGEGESIHYAGYGLGYQQAQPINRGLNAARAVAPTLGRGSLGQTASGVAPAHKFRLHPTIQPVQHKQRKGMQSVASDIPISTDRSLLHNSHNSNGSSNSQLYQAETTNRDVERLGRGTWQNRTKEHKYDTLGTLGPSLESEIKTNSIAPDVNTQPLPGPKPTKPSAFHIPGAEKHQGIQSYLNVSSEPDGQFLLVPSETNEVVEDDPPILRPYRSLQQRHNLHQVASVHSSQEQASNAVAAPVGEMEQSNPQQRDPSTK